MRASESRLRWLTRELVDTTSQRGSHGVADAKVDRTGPLWRPRAARALTAIPVSRWKLRPEVMVEPRGDGGLDLLDPLFDRLTHLDAEMVALLDASDPVALAALDARSLCAGAEADALRRAAWYARLRPEPVAPTVEALDCGALAASVASLGWSPEWRQGERWRRLLETGRSCGGPLCLPGLLPGALATAAAHQAAELPMSPLETRVVSGRRAVVNDEIGGALAAVRGLFDAPEARAALGAAVGRALKLGLTLNAWSLDPGQRMAVHPDGGRYAGTLVVGLNEAWSAADGGAIAFGDPGPDGLHVRSRWLPHLGDVLIFAPTASTWHAVEPPSRRRWTLSGWWLG